jgi:hypothetical protein
VATSSHAQVDIERMRLEPPGQGFSGRMSASLSSRSGNVDAASVTIGGRTDYVHDNRTVLVVLNGDYGWQGGRQFSDQALAHVRYVHGLNERVALEAFVQGDYNKARLLDARAVEGAGVRVVLLAGKRAGLSAGTSIMAEHEELDLPGGARHPRRTDVARWSNYAGMSWALGERSGFNVTAYAQPQVDDFADVRVIGEGTLSARVGGPVSLAVTGSLRHDSDPPDDIEKTDTKIVTGVAVSF